MAKKHHHRSSFDRDKHTKTVCPICHKTFISYNSMTSHKSREHKGNRKKFKYNMAAHKQFKPTAKERSRIKKMLKSLGKR